MNAMTQALLNGCSLAAQPTDNGFEIRLSKGDFAITHRFDREMVSFAIVEVVDSEIGRMLKKLEERTGSVTPEVGQ